MGTKYTTVTISGYNSNPPPDDGSQAASNLVTWANNKTKIGDPLKTQVAAIDAALVNALNTSCRAVTTTDSVLSTDHWKTLECSGTFTETLLDAATAGAGFTVKIVNVGTGVITIGRATAGDFINGVAINLNLAPGDSVTLTVNAAANGYVIDSGNNVDNSICQGRLSAQTGVAVPTSDVSSATSVFFVPYGGNKISLFDGTGTWATYRFSNISVACPNTSSTPFDVFAFNNAGVVALEALSWTNTSSRATSLVLQDGVLLKVGALTRRYLGTCTTIGTPGNTEDTAARRFVWSQYNYVPRFSSNSLAADVTLSNTGQFFDGPSVPVGSAEGTYEASGTVMLTCGAAPNVFNIKLWDGTTVIDSVRTQGTAGNQILSATLSGSITSPAGNIRISVQDVTATDGKITANGSGNSKDSTLTIKRVV